MNCSRRMGALLEALPTFIRKSGVDLDYGKTCEGDWTRQWAMIRLDVVESADEGARRFFDMHAFQVWLEKFAASILGKRLPIRGLQKAKPKKGGHAIEVRHFQSWCFEVSLYKVD